MRNGTHVAAFDVELVVDAGREVVQDDHLGVGRQSVLLLDADAHQRLDGGAARDAAHARWPDGVLVVGCETNPHSITQVGALVSALARADVARRCDSGDQLSVGQRSSYEGDAA